MLFSINHVCFSGVLVLMTIVFDLIISIQGKTLVSHFVLWERYWLLILYK